MVELTNMMNMFISLYVKNTFCSEMGWDDRGNFVNAISNIF